MADRDFQTVNGTTTDISAAVLAHLNANADTNVMTDAEKAKLAALNSANYATAAQGATADTALQPGDPLPWGNVTGAPTTRAGYGITDAEKLLVPSESASAAITLLDADDRKHRHLTSATPAITIPTGLTVGGVFSFSSDNPFTVTAAGGVTMVPSSPRTVAAAPKAVTIMIVAANKAVLLGDAT